MVNEELKEYDKIHDPMSFASATVIVKLGKTEKTYEGTVTILAGGRTLIQTEDSDTAIVTDLKNCLVIGIPE